MNYFRSLPLVSSVNKAKLFPFEHRIGKDLVREFHPRHEICGFGIILRSHEGHAVGSLIEIVFSQNDRCRLRWIPLRVAFAEDTDQDVFQVSPFRLEHRLSFARLNGIRTVDLASLVSVGTGPRPCCDVHGHYVSRVVFEFNAGRTIRPCLVGAGDKTNESRGKSMCSESSQQRSGVEPTDGRAALPEPSQSSVKGMCHCLAASGQAVPIARPTWKLASGFISGRTG
jgi:hypothetical protein